MADLQFLIFFYNRNYDIINMQTEGLTTEDSLLLPPAGGNCMNWALGHILVHRDLALQMLGAQPLLNATESETYKRESEQLTSTEHALPLERLLDLLHSSNQRLREALQQTSDDTLARSLGDGRKRTIGETLNQLLWHETYHIGQFELLRHLAGKHEKLI